MFLPPKMLTIICLTATVMLSASDLTAQSGSQYEQRSRAIRAARARAQQPTPANQMTAPPLNEVRQPSGQALLQQATARVTSPGDVQQVQYQQPAAGLRTGRNAQNRNLQYVPKHLRTAQLTETPMNDGTTPAPTAIPNQGSGARNPMSAPVQSNSMPMNGTVIQSYPMEGQMMSSAPVIGESYLENDGCQTCVDGGCGTGIFDSCSSCPPGDCWLNNFGRAFRTGEYFAGAMAFRGPGFNAGGQQIDDSNFGFYGGINLGIPLCKLSCGLLSGQLGIRSNQSNFDGSSFTPDNRDQLFVTAGLYRRVDYGWQIGVVADILHEEWFIESDLVQIRTDVAWAYGNGSLLGFRSANGTQDDVTQGIINGVPFGNFNTSVVDQYRFYYRHNSQFGGYGELGLGWSDNDQFLAALDFNLQLTDCIGMQSGFAYFLGDDQAVARAAAAPDNDAWNIYVGFVWRPQGRNWWKSYDRPMFDVADNGSMLIGHGN